MAEGSGIVVGIGLTGESGYVLEKVVRLAEDPNRITAVHVLEQTHLFYEDPSTLDVTDGLLQTVEIDAFARLERLCQRFGVKSHLVREGNPAAELHRVAEEQGAQLIAVGTHGRQGWRALLGDTANAVLHGTKTNVLAVYAPDELPEVIPRYAKILVAVDITPEARDVIAAAVRVREMFGADLEVLSVVKPIAGVHNAGAVCCEDESRTFDNETDAQYYSGVQELITDCGITDAKSHLRHGALTSEIHAVADEIGADLIVLGTHGTQGPALLLGSAPNTVLKGVRRDVLAVRVGLD